MSPNLPYHPNSFTCKCCWLLQHYQYWSHTATPLRYLVGALCHGEPAVLVLQCQCLHKLQQFLDGVDAGVDVGVDAGVDAGVDIGVDIGVDQLKALDMGLAGR